MPEAQGQPQLFVVVCTALHVALGPFADLGAALVAARHHTDSEMGRCNYLPVPLMLEGAQIIPIPGGPAESDDGPGAWPGMYL